jgi:hypothetical protein
MAEEHVLDAAGSLRHARHCFGGASDDCRLPGTGLGVDPTGEFLQVKGSKGWWRRGDIQTAQNPKVMQCWIHKDAHTWLSSKPCDHHQDSAAAQVL